MTKFNFDQVHSDIQFKIKHLMVSQVKGTFKQFDVQLDGDINDLTSLKQQLLLFQVQLTLKMRTETTI